MGKSLFEFANERKESQDKEKVEKFSKEESQQENLKKQFDKYSKLSQAQLTNELFSKVNEQKKKGEFNFSEISKKLEQIKPMLSEEQIRNLNNLLNQIR